MIPFIPHRWRLVCAIPFLAVALIACQSCSAVQAVADALAETHAKAAAIEKAATGIAVEASKPEPDQAAIVQAASQIASDARSIQSEVQAAQGNLGGLQDRESEWAKAIKWGGIALAVIAVVVLLVWSGAMVPIRKAFHALGWFIPEATNASATLAAKAEVAGTLTPGWREQVAADRASDPAYDAAYRRAKRKIGKAK